MTVVILERGRGVFVLLSALALLAWAALAAHRRRADRALPARAPLHDPPSRVRLVRRVGT